MSVFKKLFRKKNVPLSCTISLDDPSHVHTSACFHDIKPLSVVELFQSQGCQSCPPTIPKIHEVTNDPNLILLTYDVTYFDNQGWVDTFANKQSDNRQRAYVMKWGRNNLFTPQVIVDGLADGTGAGSNEVQEIIDQARQLRAQMDWHISLDTNGTELRIDSDKTEIESHDILLVKYDPQQQLIKVGKGTNKGKKLNHRNLVKDITKVGEWTGGNLTLPLPEQEHQGLDMVALVQAGPGGPIVASQKI
ncbi:DUF1223-domain-containing protein [Mollisia scopiformis]|uniref:DUF1223-domain-containing protein n=1 Tax=Mollisia scopiformis TaxID=149040 RepID=A0A194XPV2_MOLSC|nr:DUF1223-domain-containing protein [Mollisia scopiformis]KUJ22084.1 DUF1223-domain-containing protein [Mollisia scopiformis]